MRLLVALLLFAAVLHVSLAQDAHAPEHSLAGVKVIENSHHELAPRIKRGHSDETVELKIEIDDDEKSCSDSDKHRRRHHQRHHNRHRHHPKESCSDEDTVKIKVDVDNKDDSCSDDHRRHRHHRHRHHSKDSCADEDTVKIKLDIDEADKSCSDKSRHHKSSSESCDDSDKSVELKLNIKEDSSSCHDDSRPRHYSSHMNQPQIHYHHHNVPVHEDGYQVKPEHKYSHPQVNHDGYHHKSSLSQYASYGRDKYTPKEAVYSDGGSYGKHSKHGKHNDEPMICDSDETITIIV